LRRRCSTHERNEANAYWATDKTGKKFRQCAACKSEGNWRTQGIRNREGGAFTQADYDELFAGQDGCCLLCGVANDPTHRLEVDHDHVTGVARGLICMKCNRAVGLHEAIGVDVETWALRAKVLLMVPTLACSERSQPEGVPRR
jgi:hypothetical protein